MSGMLDEKASTIEVGKMGSTVQKQMFEDLSKQIWQLSAHIHTSIEKAVADTKASCVERTDELFATFTKQTTEHLVSKADMGQVWELENRFQALNTSMQQKVDQQEYKVDVLSGQLQNVNDMVLTQKQELCTMVDRVTAQSG